MVQIPDRICRLGERFCVEDIQSSASSEDHHSNSRSDVPFYFKWCNEPVSVSMTPSSLSDWSVRSEDDCWSSHTISKEVG